MKLTLQILLWNFDSTCHLQQLAWSSLQSHEWTQMSLWRHMRPMSWTRVSQSRGSWFTLEPHSQSANTLNHDHESSSLSRHGGWSDVWKPKITFYDLILTLSLLVSVLTDCCFTGSQDMLDLASYEHASMCILFSVQPRETHSGETHRKKTLDKHTAENTEWRNTWWRNTWWETHSGAQMQACIYSQRVRRSVVIKFL